jgi:hypothetical protein
MDNPTKQVSCEQWLHVVCLPFNIKGKNVDLEKISDALKGSAWQTEAPQGVATDDAGWPSYQRYQADAYFHPFVRRFLRNESLVRRFYRNDVKTICIELESLATGAFSVRAAVVRCELVLFQPDTGLLLLELTGAQLSLSQMQLLQDCFRRLYPPYLDQFTQGSQQTWFGGHCPFKVTLEDAQGQMLGEPGVFRGESPAFMQPYQQILSAPGADGLRYPLAAHWHHLLAPFDCTGSAGAGFSIEHLGDDRAPILSWLALDDIAAVDEGNWVRTCFADAPGQDVLPYAKDFLKDFKQDYCYDRYWYQAGESSCLPSRIMNCGYAFSYVGSCRDAGFFMNQQNGAHAIFRHIYVEMALIAHFQKAKLLSFSQRLSEMVERTQSGVQLPDQTEVRKFYDDFVEFTQRFWFDEISPQQQGIELFHMWRTKIRLQQLYDEVRQELKDLVDYTELRSAEELNRNVLKFGVLALIVALCSLGAGVFGMNKPEDMTWLFPSGEWFFLEGPKQLWWAQISLGVFVVTLVSLFYAYSKKLLSKRRKKIR